MGERLRNANLKEKVLTSAEAANLILIKVQIRENTILVLL